MKTIVALGYLLLCTLSALAQVGLICDFEGVDTLGVVVHGDTVNISDVGLCGYCSALFAVSVTQSSDSLFIVQTDTAGVIATCQCRFDVNVSVIGLDPGSYTAIVHRKYLAAYGYPVDTVLYVGAVQFTIAGPTASMLSFRSNQSECLPTGVDDVEPDNPEGILLLQISPNPFNPTTTIRFHLGPASAAAPARLLKIFNSLGQLVRVIDSSHLQPGMHTLVFDGRGLASGIYFVRLQVGEMVGTSRMVLAR